MANQIDQSTALQIVQGAGFLASGGGGSVQVGKRLVAEVFAGGATATLVDLGELAGGEWVGVAAELGSPARFVGAKIRSRAAANALLTIQAAAVAMGNAGDPYFKGFTKFDAVSSVEIGAISTLLALQTAIDVGLPAVDTDGAGRAVPTLPLLTFAGATPVVPNALTGDSAKDGSFVAAQVQVPGEPELETAAIGMIGTGLLGPPAGIATWPATVATLSQPGKMPVMGSTTHCAKLGQIIASTSGSQRVTAALWYVDGVMARQARSVYQGLVTAMDQATEGLDVGHVTISGTGGFSGSFGSVGLGDGCRSTRANSVCA